MIIGQFIFEGWTSCWISWLLCDYLPVCLWLMNFLLNFLVTLWLLASSSLRDKFSVESLGYFVIIGQFIFEGQTFCWICWLLCDYWPVHLWGMIFLLNLLLVTLWLLVSSSLRDKLSVESFGYFVNIGQFIFEGRTFCWICWLLCDYWPVHLCGMNFLLNLLLVTSWLLVSSSLRDELSVESLGYFVIIGQFVFDWWTVCWICWLLCDYWPVHLWGMNFLLNLLVTLWILASSSLRDELSVESAGYFVIIGQFIFEGPTFCLICWLLCNYWPVYLWGTNFLLNLLVTLWLLVNSSLRDKLPVESAGYFVIICQFVFDWWTFCWIFWLLCDYWPVHLWGTNFLLNLLVTLWLLASSSLRDELSVESLGYFVIIGQFIFEGWFFCWISWLLCDYLPVCLWLMNFLLNFLVTLWLLVSSSLRDKLSVESLGYFVIIGQFIFEGQTFCWISWLLCDYWPVRLWGTYFLLNLLVTLWLLVNSSLRDELSVESAGYFVIIDQFVFDWWTFCWISWLLCDYWPVHLWGMNFLLNFWLLCDYWSVHLWGMNFLLNLLVTLWLLASSSLRDDFSVEPLPGYFVIIGQFIFEGQTFYWIFWLLCR